VLNPSFQEVLAKPLIQRQNFLPCKKSSLLPFDSREERSFEQSFAERFEALIETANSVDIFTDNASQFARRKLQL
jgi:hypothetical protein